MSSVAFTRLADRTWLPQSALPDHPDNQQQTDDDRTHGCHQGPFQTVKGFRHQTLLQQPLVKEPGQTLRARSQALLASIFHATRQFPFALPVPRGERVTANHAAGSVRHVHY
jgi:hypothetical protein